MTLHTYSCSNHGVISKKPLRSRGISDPIVTISINVSGETSLLRFAKVQPHNVISSADEGLFIFQIFIPTGDHLGQRVRTTTNFYTLAHRDYK